MNKKEKNTIGTWLQTYRRTENDRGKFSQQESSSQKAFFGTLVGLGPDFPFESPKNSKHLLIQLSTKILAAANFTAF